MVIAPPLARNRTLHDARCDAHIAEQILKLHAKGNTLAPYFDLSDHCSPPPHERIRQVKDRIVSSSSALHVL